jgi:Uma2 family endonuclease
MSTPPELAISTRDPPAGRVSFEEYLDWADEDTLAEWVDGEIHFMSPTSSRDQRILVFLIKVLGIWVEFHGLGEIRSETFVMRLSGRARSGRMPDIIFIAAEHLDRLGPTYVDGPADLAIEIVSPDSVERDRVTKLDEYERGGVPEYWMLDPLHRQADFYQLGPDGRYRLVLSGPSGVYRSQVVRGFWLDVEWLWQDPLPGSLDILRELGLPRA